MKLTVADSAKDRVIFNITGGTREELETMQNLFFTSQGYKLASSEGDHQTYVKGNRVLRLLFGAFVKYHKQSVTIKNEGGLYSVMLHRDSTGVSGGIIGMNQVKKEFARLTEAYKSYFSS